MNRLLIIFVATLLVSSSASLIQPRDLADEAREQLDQLRSIVRGDIMVAHDQLDGRLSDFKAYAMDVIRATSITLEQEQEQIHVQVNSIVDLAHAAGHDVSICTNERVELINRLPTTYTASTRNCIDEVDGLAIRVTVDARYVIDISINTIERFAAQLRNCRDEITCISSVVTEIELSKIRIPQSIQTEVLTAQELMTDLKVSVQSCSDSNIAAYTAESYSILGEIQECVEEILG